MNIKNWELESELGYTFEFSYKANPNITIRIIARSEKEAWRTLSNLK
ncbi:hypothetical protein J27TS8_27360 [Robertmurraya siralis]|uniref:Uncharacterized protein n=1 Tax=Robertmurraya siralis TaxID=77777 RepID=A0A919WIN7_9BACI|nr:hypothetical protein [Robertmurraya siralis]GIN62743.1 hypothetical protein J27TS8_27360 [Robertmurraya siralis]